MLKFIKKSLIILLLIIIDTIVFLVKIIHKFYENNKSKIEKTAKSLYFTLKEELTQ